MHDRRVRRVHADGDEVEGGGELRIDDEAAVLVGALHLREIVDAAVVGGGRRAERRDGERRGHGLALVAGERAAVDPRDDLVALLVGHDAGVVDLRAARFGRGVGRHRRHDVVGDRRLDERRVGHGVAVGEDGERRDVARRVTARAARREDRRRVLVVGEHRCGHGGRIGLRGVLRRASREDEGGHGERQSGSTHVERSLQPECRS